MIVITVARKPLVSTVAKNALQYGTGGINIDASRISMSAKDAETIANMGGFGKSTYVREVGVALELSVNPMGCIDAKPHTQGRWPANLVLSHLPDCQQAGTKDVRSDGHSPASRGPGGLGTSGHKGQQSLVARKGGRETVASWDCVEGCPVRALDAQSGIVLTGTWNRQKDTAHPFGNAKNTPYETWQSLKESPGGASRFFKVVKP